jgi:hypothetical protein
MKAVNNPGNEYWAVLPNNEETERVLAYLRKHLSPDRKIVAKGQGVPTNGEKRSKYIYGIPKGVASHVRLYTYYKDPTQRSWRVRFWMDRAQKNEDERNSTWEQLDNLKKAIKEAIK